jgi:hypothetical protein
MHGRTRKFTTPTPHPQRNHCPSNNPQRNPNVKKNTINYHLSRMYPKIIGPHKRD